MHVSSVGKHVLLGTIYSILNRGKNNEMKVISNKVKFLGV